MNNSSRVKNNKILKIIVSFSKMIIQKTGICMVSLNSFWYQSAPLVPQKWSLNKVRVKIFFAKHWEGTMIKQHYGVK